MSTTRLPAATGVPRRHRRGLTVTALVAAWVTLYQLNLRWWNWVVYEAVGLRRGTRVAGSVHFFFYDLAKIALLLTGVIFLVTVLRSFMSVERTWALLGGRREGVGNVAAATLGVVTPFCSCSAVPAFIGFVAAGVPLGVTLSFLIASPLVNEVAIVLLFGLFGWEITALYVGGGCSSRSSPARCSVACGSSAGSSPSSSRRRCGAGRSTRRPDCRGTTG
jgi:uncharacterized membrane protein YraQ (UPF0718 family)